MPPNQSSEAAEPATILLVEDETLIRTVLAMDLEDAGYNIAEAGSADEALGILQCSTDIGLVVTDVKMPGSMNGLELAAWVRQHMPSAKVVVMSGYVHEDVVETAATFDAFVKKPFKPADVTGLVEKLLSTS